MALSDASDPFAVFGGYDDDDDDNSEVQEVSPTQQALLKEANKRLALQRRKPNTVATQYDAAGGSEKDETPALPEVLLGETDDIVTRPLYWGPLTLVDMQDSEVGGQRGYVARRDLPAGTLLLVEQPVWTFPDEQRGKPLRMGLSIPSLVHSASPNLLRQMEYLHPTVEAVQAVLSSSSSGTTAESDSRQILEMMALVQREATQEDNETVQTLLRERKDDGSNFTDVDLWRLLLVLRYNAFPSGLYMHCSMFNHAEENSNCVKFPPSTTASYSSSSLYFSEVRTTRNVKKGEPLTLDYVEPRELSFPSRYHHIWDQHRFEIPHPTVNPQIHLVHGTLPSPGAETPTAVKTLETTIRDLESQYAATVESAATGSEFLNALLDAVSRLHHEASTITLGNPQHVLMIRVRKLHLELLADLLPLQKNSAKQPMLDSLVSVGEALWSQQEVHLGPNHFDLGRTAQLLSDAIAFYLSSSSGSASLSRKESDYRNRYHQIRALYPHDTDQRIREYQQQP